MEHPLVLLREWSVGENACGGVVSVDSSLLGVVGEAMSLSA